VDTVDAGAADGHISVDLESERPEVREIWGSLRSTGSVATRSPTSLLALQVLNVATTRRGRRTISPLLVAFFLVVFQDCAGSYLFRPLPVAAFLLCALLDVLVHALLFGPSGLSRLVQEPLFRAEVAHRCRQNAGKYHVNSTAEKLAGLIAQVRQTVGLVAD